ncbi:DUF4365 domain-containing protein [Pedobacter sp. LMG 31464]|uniref:DUF4365 domain-containing protein n=1 Tax=Pedobacter planticolens TaxID=2679964 RepID=A0A923DXB1_9SPHI|nr:DUF4365 domain-containing protein [Pedobacter planticolens]MBB2145727.1 DUF4365 domain-containing protein [Pedobacter planticolens]
MTREEFDNQPLPKSDANANLETVSRNKLRAMFEVEDFEIRDELQYDRGIDFFIEVKLNGNHTNLRFPVQLKATNSLSKNIDGSISLSIPVVNINYLLNDGLPAFYVLYHADEDIFYYERAKEVDDRLREKYPNAHYPQSFTIKFKNLLNGDVIGGIRTEILSHGYLRRAINKALKLSEDGKELTEPVVIQKNQHVYSPIENIKFLENFGFRLLNDGRFSEILDIEKRCYPQEITSPTFHFICGTAAHYKGLHYDALRHYKLADRYVEALDPEVRNMLLYHRAQSKLNLGMIDAEQSEGYMEALMDSEYLGLFLRLQKAFKTWYISSDRNSEKLLRFHEEVNSVLASPHCSPSISMIAESYVLSVEGHRLNDQLLDYLIKLRDSMGTYSLSPKASRLRDEEVSQYNQHFTELKAKAQKGGNQFTYHAICLNGIKILYIKTFYADIVMGMDRATLTITSHLSEEEKELLRDQAACAGHIALMYEQIGVSDNMIAALSQQYELLHFVGDLELAESVLKDMENRIKDNEWHGLESKVTYLRNGGTSHELFTAFVTSTISKVKEKEQQGVILQNEIEKMDMEDRQSKPSITGEKIYLQVFPLGSFCFSKEKLESVFEVLNVTASAKECIMNIMKIGAMPIVNAFRNPIVNEGPDGGFSAERGPESLERIHKVRKDLRELGAYRI